MRAITAPPLAAGESFPSNKTGPLSDSNFGCLFQFWSSVPLHATFRLSAVVHRFELFRQSFNKLDSALSEFVARRSKITPNRGGCCQGRFWLRKRLNGHPAVVARSEERRVG